MQLYQQEYIANLRRIAALTARKKPEGLPFADYEARMDRDEAQAEALVRQNMELLRGELFPVLDNLFQADRETLEELEAFAAELLNVREEQDAGLFCQIYRALLSLARQKDDQGGMIRSLYWLGIGRNSLCSCLVGLELELSEPYMTAMRLCFTEAAAYLKYYDEIEDDQTRGYILRSRANMALGAFKSPGEKVALVRRTLQILQDQEYQAKASGLPWERFIYMTHQHMAASISYSKEKVLTPKDMTDIMESVYIVYQRRIQEAEANWEQPPVRWAFPYYAIEYYCGISRLDRLLTKMEDLMDAADPAAFTEDSMYGLISLPAFYCQYLQQYPERIPERREYVESLYRRALDYVESFPGDLENESLFRYLRQLSHTFVETEGGMPYGAFMQKLLIRFSPEIYVHSLAVGEAARALCGLIVEEEPDYFDDIEAVRVLADPEEKRQAILDYAAGCGVFHDVGKINFMNLYARTARQWFDEEYEMARLHAPAGNSLLAARPSTSRYAPAALGHHVWYDGSRGYPAAYRRLECPERQMVDVISLVDWLENVTHTARLYTGIERTYRQAVRDAVDQEGRRFSPLLTVRLQDGPAAARIEQAFEEGRRRARRQIYEAAPAEKR